MNGLDYAVVGGYLVLLLGLGYYFRHQGSRRDYFLGGRALGWFPLVLSTMATQLSAISFISAPAFVGIREGGGMIWLSYELAVPLAMIVVMRGIMPQLYRAGFVSIYEFLEVRFDQYTRFFISIVFQISRAFATGIMIYAIALVLESMMGIGFWTALAVIGVITALYSLQGGMKAIVYADAAQMVLIFTGILLCTGFGLYRLGGLERLFEHVEPARLLAVDFSSFGFSGDEFGFLPMLFGGLVLYASYYGCDQTQAQRILSAQSEGVARKILVANGLLRFPTVVMYCLMGLVVGTLATLSSGFGGVDFSDAPDRLVPTFIVTYLPHGVIGLLVVGVLSAVMSSLSSVINSLSAVTVEDLAMLRGARLSERRYVFWSRVSASAWAVAILLFSVFGGMIAETVIEAINKVGSLFYGPILATFVLAVAFNGVTARAANWGLLAGVLSNLLLWSAAPNIFWFWWNLTGFLADITVALIVSRSARLVRPAADGAGPDRTTALRQTLVLVIAFLVIVAITVSSSSLWQGAAAVIR